MKPKSKFRARSGDYRILLRWRQEIRNYSFDYLARLVAWLQEKRKAESRKMKLVLTNGGVHLIGNDEDFLPLQNVREFVVDKSHPKCVCIVLERRGETSEGHPFAVQVLEFLHEKEAAMAETLFYDLKRKMGECIYENLSPGSTPGLVERTGEVHLVPHHEDSSDSEAQHRTRDQSLQVSLGPDENEGWSEEERQADRRRIEQLTRMLQDLKRKVKRQEMRDQACSPFPSAAISPRPLSLTQWRQSSQDGMKDVLLLPAKDNVEDNEVQRILERNDDYSINSAASTVASQPAGASTASSASSLYGQTGSVLIQPGLYSPGVMQPTQTGLFQSFNLQPQLAATAARLPIPMAANNPLFMRFMGMPQNGALPQPRRPLMPFGGLNRYVMTVEDLEAPSPCPVPEIVHEYEPENTRSILKRVRDPRADKKVTFVQ